MFCKILKLSLFLLTVTSIVFAESPIKVFYWQASDVRIQKDEIEYLTGAMIETQSFFASEMDRYGFGEKTFAFDDIEIVEAKQKLRHYTSALTIQEESTVIEWGLDNQIYVVFFGGTGEIGGNTAISQQLCANIPEQLIYCNNLVVVPTEYREILLPLLAHEIGHAFSLGHAAKRLIANQVDVMYLPLHVTPGVTMTLKDFALNQKDAEFLEAGDRLSVQQSPQETAINADVNNDGYIAGEYPSLVAYYPFEGNPEDISGNDNHSEIIGGYKWVKGKFGDAIELGAATYVKMQASDSLHEDFFKEGPFTISTWINPNFLGNTWQHIWRGLHWNGIGDALFIEKDQGLISWRGPVGGQWTVLCETAGGIVKADQWMHIAVTGDGDKFKIYADGEMVAETNFQATDGAHVTYRIGGSWHEAFAGLMDDYAIFSRALDEDEISLIMDSVETFLEAGDRLSVQQDSQETGIDGDVNNDGYVDLYDVLIVRRGMNQSVKYDTDINDDGVTDEVDLHIVKSIAMQAIAAASPRKRKINITTWADLKRQ